MILGSIILFICVVVILWLIIGAVDRHSKGTNDWSANMKAGVIYETRTVLCNKCDGSGCSHCMGKGYRLAILPPDCDYKSAPYNPKEDPANTLKVGPPPVCPSCNPKDYHSVDKSLTAEQINISRGYQKVSCWNCHGSFRKDNPCPKCDGTGYTWESPPAPGRFTGDYPAANSITHIANPKDFHTAADYPPKRFTKKK